MIFSGIFKKLFKRKTKTFFLNRDELFNHVPVKNQENMDKSIFEIVYAIAMKEHTSLISGRVKRGFFRTGDNIDICSPSEMVPKFNAIIINIKTALVDVNKIGSGSEADFLIKLPEDNLEINPGDRVYKY